MRQKWENYFIGIAKQVATRSTCDRANVGAVITDNEKRIIATGYNGSAGKNSPHCDDVGHKMRDNHCIATVHAEQNAIADCARAGKAINGSTIYITHFPCLNCTKLIISAGIKKVVFETSYSIDEYALELLKINEVKVFKADDRDYLEEMI